MAYKTENLNRTLICEYAGYDEVVTSIDDNKTEMDAYADIYLDQAAEKFKTLAGAVKTYRGIHNIICDGLTRQVEWQCAMGKDPPWQTTASQNSESIPNVIRRSEKDRRRANRRNDDVTQRRRNEFRRRRKKDDPD